MLTYKNLGRYGRIGNQMFEIAGTIGLAKKYGYEFGFPYWQNYDQLERFGGGEDIDIQKWFKNPLPLIDEDIDYGLFRVPWGYHDVEVGDNHNIEGHMQSERYFLHCDKLIRHYFTFANETEKNDNTLAVHFRGGDYGGDYHPTMSERYYAGARSKFPDDMRCLLFTDDPQRAAQAIPFNYELVEGNHSMIDMEIMSKCDHHIIANSTFSWWGAWLANSKKVVAPRKWFGKEAKINGNDLYCKGWEVL